MAALVCEICGGKLMAKSGGLFECEYCGMQYDKTRIQEMVQEIKGTVKVEGTVEVTGTVKVEGGANKESLLKRGYLALEDQKWEDAEQHFDAALNFDAECAEAYLGKLLAELKVRRQEELVDCEEILSDKANFQKALRFADVKLRNILEECLKQDDEKKSRKKALAYRQRRLKHMIAVTYEEIYAVKSDGTVLIMDCHDGSIQKAPIEWYEIIEIVAKRDDIYALKADGTVMEINKDGKITQLDCCDVVTLFSNNSYAVGLKRDGTVAFKGEKPDYAEKLTDIVDCYEEKYLKADGTIVDPKGYSEINEWRNIVSISMGPSGFFGLKADGTLKAKWWYDENSRMYARFVGEYGLHEVLKWGNIAEISGCGEYIAGLQHDGKVIIKNNDKTGCRYLAKNSTWENVIAIYTSDYTAIGLKRDGTFIAAIEKFDRYWQCEEKLFHDLENLEQERAIAREEARKNRERYLEELRAANEQERRRREQAEEMERIAQQKRKEEERIAKERAEAERKLRQERQASGLCQYCGGELKGLFSKKCVSCGKPKDY